LEDLAVVGQRVEIPFGSGKTVGLVVARSQNSEIESPRDIEAVLDELPLLFEWQLELAKWLSRRYCAPLGEVIKAMLPSRVRASRPGGRKSSTRSRSRIVDEEVAPDTPHTLTPEQSAALSSITAALEAQQFRAFLLHGVTGSGKTEVYLQAITAVVARGRQAIVLVPEIALTPQTMRRFVARFGERVTVMHSSLTEAERAVQWRRIRAGEIDVVVGSRSAVFAPTPNPGIVVADEEDSPSYKQDRIPRYHAIDTALELGRLRGVPVVLGSATPRVETFYAAHTGSMELLPLPERMHGKELPKIDLVDLREEFAAGNRGVLSSVLSRALADCFKQGGQSILFLNRRGSATFVMCRKCGNTLTCKRCSVSLVFHHTKQRCDCHYCGFTAPLPSKCEVCGSDAIRQMGTGTERLEAGLAEDFPTMRLLRMDRDTTKTRDSHFEIFERFRRGEADCLVGTQMVTKGWDLDNVRLVGIVNADTSLHFPDYRSGEITFSLLTQVAGRTGRGKHEARVVLQTYSPEHYAIAHALTHDYLGFAREEIRFRKLMHFPPYSQLVTCTYAHRKDESALAEATRAAEELRARLSESENGSGVEVLGPSTAFVHRLRGVFRWQLLIRAADVEPFLHLLPRGRGWSIDVDPSA